MDMFVGSSQACSWSPFWFPTSVHPAVLYLPWWGRSQVSLVNSQSPGEPRNPSRSSSTKPTLHISGMFLLLEVFTVGLLTSSDPQTHWDALFLHGRVRTSANCSSGGGGRRKENQQNNKMPSKKFKGQYIYGCIELLFFKVMPSVMPLMPSTATVYTLGLAPENLLCLPMTMSYNCLFLFLCIAPHEFNFH